MNEISVIEPSHVSLILLFVNIWVSCATYSDRSHVTSMSESCHIQWPESCHVYEWVMSRTMSGVMSHVWVSHVTYNERSHVTRMSESWHIQFAWCAYMSHVYMHVTHIYARDTHTDRPCRRHICMYICHTHVCMYVVMSHICMYVCGHFTHMYVCRTYVCMYVVMSHICMYVCGHVTHMYVCVCRVYTSVSHTQCPATMNLCVHDSHVTLTCHTHMCPTLIQALKKTPKVECMTGSTYEWVVSHV